MARRNSGHNPAHNPKHSSSCDKHGGGSVMAWACMAATGTGTLIFIDDVTSDGSCAMDSEVYRNILSAHVPVNASELIGGRLILQQDDDVKHPAKATPEFLKDRKNK